MSPGNLLEANLGVRNAKSARAAPVAIGIATKVPISPAPGLLDSRMLLSLSGSDEELTPRRQEISRSMRETFRETGGPVAARTQTGQLQLTCLCAPPQQKHGLR